MKIRGDSRKVRPPPLKKHPPVTLPRRQGGKTPQPAPPRDVFEFPRMRPSTGPDPVGFKGNRVANDTKGVKNTSFGPRTPRADPHLRATTVDIGYKGNRVANDTKGTRL